MERAWSAEGAGRLERARAALRARGWDALILTTGPNLVYLSGYPSVERTLARPFLFVLPADGPTTLIVHLGREAEARRYAWADRVRTYERLSVAPVEQVRAALLDGGIERGTVGAELGYEQRLGIPPLELERIAAGIAPATLVDAADLLWGMRMRKSAAEIEALTEACRITSAAYQAVLPAIRPGMRELDVALALQRAMVEGGGSDPWVAITSGPGNYDLATGVGTARLLEGGDMVWADAGCAVRGYWSDFGRAAILGPISEERARTWRAVHEVTLEGVRMAVPGTAVAEIARHVEARLEGLGLPVTSSISGLAGRVGHGVGLDITEPPHVAPHDQTLLEAGMVITIEPGVATATGIYHVEEQLLVTDGAPQLLSSPRWELYQPDGWAAGR